MRQAGLLKQQAEAERFADFLIAEGVVAHAEKDGEGWAIWVRDENELDRARQELEKFRENPLDKRYVSAGTRAQEARRQAEDRYRESQKNVIRMGQRWQTGAGRRAPLTFVLIGASVLVFLVGSSGKNPPVRYLYFTALRPAYNNDAWDQLSISEKTRLAFVDIQKLEVWRLFTPMFIHGDIMHLVFNMYILYYFGTQIEASRGSLKFLLLVLLIAAVSNVAEACLEAIRFGGMSGVNYGLFGYVWMKMLFDRGSGLYVSQINILILVAWFFICLSGAAGGIANVAHGAGLAVGIVVGYLPVLFKPGGKQ